MTEIIIAISLFALLAAGMYSTFLSAGRWVQPTSNNQNVATYVAAGELEALYLAVRQDWWEGAGATGKPLTAGAHLSPNVTLDGVAYTKAYTVTAVTGTGNPDYRKVEETVSW